VIYNYTIGTFSDHERNTSETMVKKRSPEY